MEHNNITKRFFASFITNIIRAGLLFLTGLLIARSMGPSQYGTFTFLSGSFMAIMQLLDMGSSSAFYTFISQKKRGPEFIKYYLFWQSIQFIVPLLLIAFILPESWVDKIWMGNSRTIVSFAFIAIFSKNLLWQTVTQIGESQRLTYRVQALSVLLASTYLIAVLVSIYFGNINQKSMFGIIIIQYAFVFAIAFFWLMPPKNSEVATVPFYQMLGMYKTYCTPLILSAWIGFGYTFADTWMLQNYGGSIQQGLFAVGYQISMVGQIVILALFQIIWKEIAEAYAKGDMDRAKYLFLKSTKFVYMSVAVLCVFFIPWSDQIIYLAIGPEYIEGRTILSIMFLYPLFMCINQITDAWMMATSQVRVLSVFGIIFMFVSIVVVYFVLAPTTNAIPGLELGGMGVAMKLLLLNIIYSNIKLFWLSRKHGWKYAYEYQIAGVIGCVGFAYLSRASVDWLEFLPYQIRIVGSFVVYTGLICSWLKLYPASFGLSRDETQKYFGIAKNKIFSTIRRA